MKIMIEVDGTNPRTGAPDVAYLTVVIDDLLIRSVRGSRKAYIMQEVGNAIDKLLETEGVLQ